MEPPRRGLHLSIPDNRRGGSRPVCGQALIDGEAVVLRDDRRSDFGAPMTKRDRARASLLAFPLLHLKEDDMSLRPLEARREELIMTALVPSKRNML